MKTFQITNVLLAGVLLFLAPCRSTLAQDTDAVPVTNAEDALLPREVTFLIPDDDPLDIQFISVRDSVTLLELVQRLPGSQYPVVVLKDTVFENGIQAVNNIRTQILLYELRDQRWQRLDSINALKVERYKEIIDLQEERVVAYDSANAQLNRQILLLNDQLTNSMELTNRSLRGRQFRNISFGVLGGLFGFSLAAILME